MAHLTNSDTDRPCPKCGFEQAHGRECIACGVDFAEFNARWEASKADHDRPHLLRDRLQRLLLPRTSQR